MAVQTETFTNIMGAQINNGSSTLLGVGGSTANYLTNVQGNVTFQSNNVIGYQVNNQSYFTPLYDPACSSCPRHGIRKLG